MDQDLPGVSVVMPLLNQAAFLEESVRTVVEQPLERLELVVMDGGSTDGGLSVLSRLADRYPGRIRWFSAPDGGPAEAINRAVRMARHELLGWLPADDLYTPGAVLRAAQAFRDHPLWQIVYGEGEHVDLVGRSLGRYPTLGPDTPITAFADGCFVCQPTLFMRRAVWLNAGGLDESLRASFDFELWLRLFRAHAGSIGFVGAVQALSRLHEGGITARQRERVALEGLRVLRRHLGVSAPHWLLTHFNECLAIHPFEPQALDLVAHLKGLVAKAAGDLEPAHRADLEAWIDGHQALQCGSPEWQADAHLDGWLPAQAEVRLRHLPPGATAVRLQVEHRHPAGLPLRLTVSGPGGLRRAHEWAGEGALELNLPLPSGLDRQRCVWRLDCEGFVPAELDAANTDRRRLGVLLRGLRVVHPPS